MFISKLKRPAVWKWPKIAMGLPPLLVCAMLLAGPAAAQEEEDPFAFRADEELYQLEEAIAIVVQSLNKISDQVSLLAINSVHYGKDIDGDFREKARVIFLEHLLDANPAIKLVRCQECEKLETKIVRGVLHIKKGIPTVEARRELARKLGVQGFLDIGMFREGHQLTVYLQVTEAETGAIILVEELTGRRAPKRETLAFGFGEMIFPIKVGGKTIDHRALMLSVREGIQLTERMSFGVELVLYLDNNANNSEANSITLDTGMIIAPTLGYDLMQFPSSASRLITYFGLGKLISSQLGYADFYKAGVVFVAGDDLEVLIGINIFPGTDVEDGNELTGQGTELRFGYRF